MIQIALYRGTSWVSRLIRWQTRGRYSHVAAIMDDGSVIEAWHIGGVCRVPSLMTNHLPGTEIDILGVDCSPKQESLFYEFLSAQVGMPYDFWAVFQFVTRKPVAENGKWFCSELVFAALRHAGIQLLVRIRDEEVSPKLLSLSPVLVEIQL